MNEEFEKEFKDFKCPFLTILEQFKKLNEKQQITFCKVIEECWEEHGVIKKIFEDVVRDIYTEIACKAKDMDELNGLRNGLLMFKKFERSVKTFIDYRKLFLKGIKSKEEDLIHKI